MSHIQQSESLSYSGGGEPFGEWSDFQHADLLASSQANASIQGSDH